MADYSNTELGKDTVYSTSYDPALLDPIPRAIAREQLEAAGGPLPDFIGVDLWTGFEVSWLNTYGMPQVAIVEFLVPCTSVNIVESKSFKLYLNSFNQTQFESQQAVQECMAADLSAAAQGDVEIIFYQLAEYNGFRPVTEPQGQCLDQQHIAIDCYTPNPDFLVLDKAEDEGKVVAETVYSHLLRTNCPVTDQPDWASLYISYQGAQIDRAGLLKYLVSFRQHQDFHEQCVEKIYADIMQRCQPEQLDVYARYMRRGGLDINPFRSSRYPFPPGHRQVRQ
ncbi:NADPH-dependent 7-cyano-7-deazaguanine reductase [Gammaproteobacteria bacterium MOLA455]|nr:NADPH-dependent 7-cyano-7-deazaguanine reductase [Gammaproteobacteria bacterium MOLA455]